VFSRCAAAFIAIIACLTLLPPAWADGQIVMGADTCFAGMAARGAYPIVITIANRGRAVRGMINVQPAAFTPSGRIYSYPIDLPEGAVKRIVSYPVLDTRLASGIDISFDGPGHVKTISLSAKTTDTEDYYSRQIGLIGDNIGGLGGIKDVSIEPAPPGGPGKITYNDCYCRPEDAPDRAAGYGSLDTLMIGEGAERLTETQWDAIRDWVVGGGNLILLGGAGSLSYLRTAGASDLCPCVNLQETRIPRFDAPLSSGPAQYYNVSIIRGAVRSGVSSTGMQSGQDIVWHRCYGVGEVTLVGFNPLADPIRATKDEGPLLALLITSSLTPDSRKHQEDLSTIATPGYPRSTLSRRSEPVGPGNPFHVVLPPIGLVTTIFIFYFILTIPVTYITLRRLGRLEWAWVTTPLISILFAFIIYLFNASLYHAGLSRRTSGVLDVAEGETAAVFKGSSDMFFPRGGTFDIKVDNASSLEQLDPSGMASYATGRSSQEGTPLQTFETPTGIEAPDYRVTNLAFRRVYYRQSVTLDGPITCQIRKTSSGYKGTVTNGSTISLNQVKVGDLNLGTLAPGQTASVLTSSNIPAVLMTAHLSGAKFGPQTGNDVSEAESVIFKTYLPVESSGGPP